MRIDFKDPSNITFDEMHRELLPHIQNFALYSSNDSVVILASAVASYLDAYQKGAKFFGMNVSPLTLMALGFYLGMQAEREGWAIPDEE